MTADPAAVVGTGAWTNVTALVGSNPGSWVEGAMTWDTSDGYVLLWGGVLGNSTSLYRLNETWTYTNGTWSNVTSHVTGGHPPGLFLNDLAYDPSSGVVIAYGVETWEGGFTNATWSNHNLVWANITATAGPAPSLC